MELTLVRHYMKNVNSEAIKYRLLVRSRLINWLNRTLRPTNWLVRLRTKATIDRIVRDSGQVKLNIGCGRTRIDNTWLHADIHRGEIYVDVLKRLPFDNNMVDFIFSEHLLNIFLRKRSESFGANVSVF